MSPLWILNVVPLIYICCLPCLSGGQKILKSFVLFFEFVCILIFQILLCINLQEARWKWAIVFIPWFVFQGIQLLGRLIDSRPSKYKEAIEMSSIGTTFGLGYFGFILHKVFTPILVLLFAILLVLRLDQTNWSWWINSIPIYILMVWKIASRIGDDISHLNSETDPEEKLSASCSICVLTFVLIFFVSFFFSSVIMVFVKLAGSSLRLVFAFIPIYILIGFLLLCICCCAPLVCCSICCASPDDEQVYEHGSPTEGWETRFNLRKDGGPRINQKYLTYGTTSETRTLFSDFQ